MNRILLIVGLAHEDIHPFMDDHGLGATAFAIVAKRSVESMQSFSRFDFVILEGVKVPPDMLSYLEINGRQVTLRQTPLQRSEQWIGRRIGRFIKRINRLHKFLYASRRVAVKSPYSMDE